MMKRRFFAVALFTVFALSVAANAGWISRYWDGCKPSCSWSDKKQSISGAICKECNKSNSQLSPTNDMNKSSCDEGVSYTCWDMIPFRDPDDANKAYAFAATPTDRCGVCFEIKFDGGFKHGNPYSTHAAIKNKTLIVMGSNMGGDVGEGQFDVLIPGGGLGQFDSFSGQLGVSKSQLGEPYGGLLSACENELKWDQGSLSQYQTCLKNKCNAVFTKSEHAQLKEGCNFYADWFMAANNPTMTYKEITCPQILIDRYKTGSNTPTPTPNGGGGDPPPGGGTTTYTLTTSVNPPAGGSVSRNNAGPNYAQGASVTVTATAATGYSFTGWSGASTSTNASVTITMNANQTLTANFQQSSGGGSGCNESLPENQRLTLTINIEPAGAGSVVKNPNNGCYTAEQQVTLTAAPASGYDFEEWVGEGLTNAKTSPTTIQMWWHRTITAKFKRNGQLSARNVIDQKTRSVITLKPMSGGFSALLPVNHGYTQYKLIDAQGRAIRSGKIGAGAADLRFNNITRSVMFLKLEGTAKSGASVVLKAVTY